MIGHPKYTFPFCHKVSKWTFSQKLVKIHGRSLLRRGGLSRHKYSARIRKHASMFSLTRLRYFPPRGPSAGHQRPSRPYGLRSLTQTRAIKRPNEKSPANCGTLSNSKNENLELPPDHFVNDAGVALDDFRDLDGYVFFDIVRHGDAIVAVLVHRDGGIDGLQERLFVDDGREADDIGARAAGNQKSLATENGI